jgi:hypothetical protein
MAVRRSGVILPFRVGVVEVGRMEVDEEEAVVVTCR